MSSRSQSPALPDYYRCTRLEQYGPQPRGYTVCGVKTPFNRRAQISQYGYSNHMVEISEEGYESDDEALKDSDINLIRRSTNSSIVNNRRCKLKGLKRLIARLVKRCTFKQRKEVVVRPASSLSIDLND